MLSSYGDSKFLYIKQIKDAAFNPLKTGHQLIVCLLLPSRKFCFNLYCPVVNEEIVRSLSPLLSAIDNWSVELVHSVMPSADSNKRWLIRPHLDVN